MEFDDVLKDHYLNTLAEIKLWEEKIACLDFCIYEIMYGDFRSEDYRHVLDASHVIRLYLNNQLIRTYNSFFVFSNMFTEEERETIQERSLKKYYYMYEQMLKRLDLKPEDIPAPRSHHMRRDTVSKIVHEKNVQKLVDKLKGEDETKS